MAEVGESTGALQEMLNTVADFYDEEIATTMDRFVTLVEPVLLIVMGLVIAGPGARALHAAVPAQFRCWRDKDMATTRNTELPPVPVALGTISDVDHREELARAQKLAER